MRGSSARERDEGWFEDMFRAQHRAVLAYARRRVPADEADDVVSEVFAAAWRHRAALPDEPLPWLYRTAGNHVLHRRRSAARRGRLDARLGGLADENAVDRSDDVADRLDAQVRVRGLLDGLPPRDAEVLRLAVWEELDVPAIAYVLGVSTTAARVRLHRARRRAEQMLHRPSAVPAERAHALATEELS